MKKLLTLSLAFLGSAFASSLSALDQGTVKHYQVGEQVVIPIELDDLPGGSSAFACLEANTSTATYTTDYDAVVNFSASSKTMYLYVNQCQNYDERDENGNLNRYNWHNSSQNKWIEVIGLANVPGEYNGTVTIKKSGASGVTKSFRFVIDGMNTVNEGSDFAVLFSDSSASYNQQIDINMSIKNVSSETAVIKSNSYVDYYLSTNTLTSNNRPPMVDVWYNPLGNTGACVQVYSCDEGRYLVREYVLSERSIASGRTLNLPQVGYRETRPIDGDKRANTWNNRDYSYQVPSHDYESKAYNRNAHYEDHIALYSEGVRVWGSSPTWLNSCRLATSSEVTLNGSSFCDGTPVTVLEESDGEDEIFEGEDYFFMPKLTSNIGIDVSLEPVQGFSSPLNWIEVGTPADYWTGDYDNLHNNNVNTARNRQMVYIRSRHSSIRMQPTIAPGTYKYRILIKEKGTSTVKASITRTIIVKDGSQHEMATGKKVAVLMGDETWFKIYQLDIASGIVNFSNEDVNLSNFSYEYYGNVESTDADFTKAKYKPHYWWPTDPNSNPSVTFVDCGQGRFRVRYHYEGTFSLASNRTAFDNKLGFVYGSNVYMEKEDDFSMQYFGEDAPRRRYNPNMALYDANRNILWGRVPSWANSCPDHWNGGEVVIDDPPNSSSSTQLVARFQGSANQGDPNVRLNFDIKNEGNTDVSLANYELWFYFNDDNAAKMPSAVYDIDYPQGVVESGIQKCTDNISILKLKFGNSASVGANQSFPNGALQGRLHDANWIYTYNGSNFISWNNSSELTANPKLTLYNAAGNKVYGATPPACGGIHISSSSSYSPYRDLAVRFAEVSSSSAGTVRFAVDVVNKGNVAANIGGYTARFYYDDLSAIADTTLNFYSEGIPSEIESVTKQQCAEHLFALNFKFKQSASIAPNGVLPRDSIITKFEKSPSGLITFSDKGSWKNGVTEMTENLNMALFDAQGHRVYGHEAWACTTYTKKTLNLVVKGNVFKKEWHADELDKDIDTAAVHVKLYIENTGDSVVSGPVYVDYQITHPAGFAPIFTMWGKTLYAPNASAVLSNNIMVSHLSAGSNHTFRFTLFNGIGAKNTQNANTTLEFDLYDQCIDGCKHDDETISYLWDLNDDWSAKGIKGTSKSSPLKVAPNVPIYNSKNEKLYGEPDKSSPVFAVKENAVNGEGSLKAARAQIDPQVPNRTDAVAYSIGQILSGGDFETQWIQGWDVQGESGESQVVKSVRGKAPQGSRYLHMDMGTSISQTINDNAYGILADSGAVLTLWHMGDSGTVAVNDSLIKELHRSDRWVVDTIPLPKTVFGELKDYVLKVTSVNDSLLIDDAIMVPSREAQPTTYATRFTNTSGEELETRAYDGYMEQIVTTSQRDAMGRLSRKYLPFAMPCKTTEECNSDLKTLYNPGMATSFYTADNEDYPDAQNYPYVETRWKPDPMATKDVESAPGFAFSIGQNHVVRSYSSGVNLSGINLLDYSSLNSAVKAERNWGNANYHAAKDTNATHLWEMIVDQNHNRAFTVKDAEGHVIVSGALDSATGNILARTVNELDARGNIVKTHPPMSCEYTSAPANCVDPSTYVYDAQSRVISSWEPDAHETRTYYDFAGRVRATQTQNQVDSNKATFIGYDHLDRTIYTGEKSMDKGDSATRADFMDSSYANIPLVDDLIPGTITRTFYDDIPSPDTLNKLRVTAYPAGVEPAYLRGRVSAVISDVRVVIDDNGDTLKSADGADSVIRVSMASSYDKYGRIRGSYSFDPTMPAESLKTVAVETEYDLGGKVTKTTKYPFGFGTWGHMRAITERYTYDRLGRVDSVFSNRGNGEQLLAYYEYYPTGALKKVVMGNSITLSYTYHISGAMKSAVAMSSDERKLFADTLYYEDCGKPGCAQYNGNISRMAHHIAFSNDDYHGARDVQYTYDQLNRLVKVNDAIENDFDELFAYDAQGRITAQRRAGNFNNGNGGEYTYESGSNMLKSVANGMGGTADSRNMSDQDNFVYDSEGKLTEDKSKSLKISYDWKGMPVEFTRNDACTDIHEQVVCGSMKLVMAYDGSGRRISKTRMRDYGNGVWDTLSITHYTGIGTEIRENFAGESPETKIVVNMPEGLGRYGIEDAVTPYSNINSFEWYLKNNLGSTMLVYGLKVASNSEESNVLSMKAAYDYRAFGEQVVLSEPADKVTENFTGKELDDEIALNYFGARYLDPMLGLWISVDPKRQFASPYLYVGNGMNPITAVDNDGNGAYIPFVVAMGYAIIRQVAIRTVTRIATVTAPTVAINATMKASEIATKAQSPAGLKVMAGAGAAGEALSRANKDAEKAFDEVVDNLGGVASDPASSVFGASKTVTQEVIDNPPDVKGFMDEIGGIVKDAMNSVNEDFNQQMNNYIKNIDVESDPD